MTDFIIAAAFAFGLFGFLIGANAQKRLNELEEKIKKNDTRR